MADTSRKKLLELAGLFLRLGFTAFGGPAAHIAMLHDEVVTRRKWLTDEDFMDMVGAANLIPGPNSTETVIHVGYRRAGLPGLLAGGVSFILPAAFMVTVLSWAYVQFGTLPQAEALLAGVKPVVVVLIAQALWKLGKKAVKGPFLAAIGALVLGGYFLGIHELLLLGGGALLVLLQRVLKKDVNTAVGMLVLPSAAALKAAAASVSAAVPFTLSRLFFTFLKIGSVLYGSGYVLLAFLQTDFVTRYGWLTEQQLIDAVAIGQVTPGPVFTTATFIGYVLGGFPGALLATVAIFLPSFFFVALTNPLIPRMRSSKVGSGLLDGVNAAALGLMAAVTIQLARFSLTDLPAILLAAAAAVLLFRFKVKSLWLVLGGAAMGVLFFLL